MKYKSLKSGMEYKFEKYSTVFGFDPSVYAKFFMCIYIMSYIYNSVMEAA